MDSNKAQILIVDDSSTIRNVIKKHLGSEYITLQAENGEEGWRILKENKAISLIFADMHMPVMNGMLLLKQIRESGDAQIADLPVIMITGHEDSEAAKQASFKVGASDFISKPFSEVDILTRAQAYVKFNKKIAELEQTVVHDTLTSLYNEQGFAEIAEKALASSYRHQHELSLMKIQVNKYAELTAQYGKKVIEQILIRISQNFKQSLRKEEILSHNGDGNFSILLPMTSGFKAHIVAIRLQNAIGKLAFAIDDNTVSIEIAIGLASTEGLDKGKGFEDLNNRVEEALSTSIEKRNCKVVYYDEQDSDSDVNDIEAKLSVKQMGKKRVDESSSQSNGNDEKQIERYGNHLLNIFNCNFDAIPSEDIDDLIKPLQAFLEYAQQQEEKLEPSVTD